MELKREQIIKDLERFHHRILNSKLAEKVTEGEIMAIIDALSLIKELTEENERLKAECENQSTLWKRNFESIYETAKETLKADTVRKMHEKVKAKILEINGNLCGLLPFIDQIAKEMEENKDEKNL